MLKAYELSKFLKHLLQQEIIALMQKQSRLYLLLQNSGHICT